MPPPSFDAAAMQSFSAADLAYTRLHTRRSLRLPDSALEERRFGGATALRGRSWPEPYYNRVIGFSEEGLPDLDALLAWYAPGRCHLTLTPDRATPALLEALAARGFGLVRSDVVLATMPDRAPATPPGVTVRRAGRADLDAVFDLWQLEDPAPIPPAVRARRAEAQLDPAFHLYLAERAGEPVAMATTFVAEGLAWLGNAQTHPDHRRKGCHAALLARRIQDAGALGCRWVITDTAFGSTSHRNAERAGLRVVFFTFELQGPVCGD
ncbi:MAG: GNAT family N-acetyltransferase [Alphaproteobacteria bacterium]|nr:GNAT family N-acetyltransferase [Alphaproteobacteria bacterium]